MLSDDWLRAFLPVGHVQAGERWSAVGAGVLFSHRNILWIVTANHVVEAAGPSISVLQSHGASERVALLELGEVQREHGLGWLRDEPKDIAAAVMPRFPGIDVKAISKELCLPLSGVMPSMLSFTVGCPYGVRGFDPSRATPLVLDGVISGTSPKDGLVYTSTPTFPGNSGGPLIVYRSPVGMRGAIYTGTIPILLAGIVLETAMVPPPDGVTDSPPLRLGITRSIDAVLELLDSEDATQMLNRVDALHMRKG